MTHACAVDQRHLTLSKIDWKKYDSSTIIGSDQLNWIDTTIESINANWIVLGNQVLFNRLFTKNKTEKFNRDEWVNYPRERSMLKNILAKAVKNKPIIFTGNHHNPKYFILREDEKSNKGDTIAWEFMPGGISSGNFGEKGDISAYHDLVQERKINNPHMPWFDLTKHGFIIADFTLNTTKVDFYVVSTIWSKEYTLKLMHSRTLD